MKVKEKKLTVKQQRFVDAYQGNATQAALAAGYSIKRASEIGYQLLQKTTIVLAIKARQAIEASPVIASRQERQAMWTAMMRDPELDPKHRLKASELLGKSEADFTENLNVRIGLEEKLKAMSDDELSSRLAAMEAVIKKQRSPQAADNRRQVGSAESSPEVVGGSKAHEYQPKHVFLTSN